VPETQILIDDGVPGVTLDRPALRQLHEVLRTGAVSAVIVLDPDRLARKIGKLLVLKDELDEAGVKLMRSFRKPSARSTEIKPSVGAIGTRMSARGTLRERSHQARMGYTQRSRAM
jgi:hypothetical protein